MSGIRKSIIAKMNYAKSLIKKKQYAEAVNYLENPFIITAAPDIMLLLSYDVRTMKAPELIFPKKGTIVVRLLKIMKEKNVPIVKNSTLARKIMKDSKQFSQILPENYIAIAEIIVRIIKNHRKKGTYYYNNNKHDRAIAALTVAIGMVSDYALSYHWRGNAYLLKGDYDNAIKDISSKWRLRQRG